MTNTSTRERNKNTVAARGFRADIEGLRAIAVLAVVIYHLQPAWLPGGFVGVDIFFVISGFLITSHLAKELHESDRIALGRFYARRMVRLVPAATLVLIVTVAAAVLFTPQTTWKQIGVDVFGAAFYVVNWIFAARSVDYLAEDSAESPVQHFWSLSVEEQYYFVWPLLIVAAAYLAVRKRKRPLTMVAAFGGGVLVISFACALLLTYAGDVTAYFATPARLWELAIGAVLALVHPAFRAMSANLQRIGYYFGAVLLAVAVIFIAGDTPWPGPATLLPTAGAAMMIAFGGHGSTFIERLVSVRPMIWVGGISYSLYLWHWPIYVYASYVWPNPSWKVLVACFVASVVLAWASKQYVEDPIRKSGWARSRVRHGLTLGIALAVVSAVAATTLVVGGANTPLQAPNGAKPKGAMVLGSDPTAARNDTVLRQPEWVLPSPSEATADVPALYEDGCQQDQDSSEVLICEYGDTQSSEEIIVVGDSKANQWLPALDTIGQRLSIKVSVMTKSACSYADAPSRVNGSPYPSCDEWNKEADVVLEERRPLAVVTSMASSEASVPGNEQSRHDAMALGLADKLRNVSGWTDHVIVLADNPHPKNPVYECVAEQAEDVRSCAFSREDAIADSAISIQRQAVESAGGVILGAAGVGSNTTGIVLADMTDYICPPQIDSCPAVIGNALTYRQGSHLTATYVETLREPLARMMTGILGK